MMGFVGYNLNVRCYDSGLLWYITEEWQLLDITFFYRILHQGPFKDLSQKEESKLTCWNDDTVSLGNDLFVPFIYEFVSSTYAL